MNRLITLLTLALFSLAALSPPAGAVLSLSALGARSFENTCTITSAAAATAIHCLPVASVPSNGTVYLTGFIANVSGSTAWGTTATCTIQDTAASPVTLATFAVAQMTANAVLGPFSTGVTLATPMKIGSGATAHKGLDIKCNATGTGSDFVVTVFGVIK